MTIYLHKILPVLVSPIFLIIAVLLLAVWWKRRRLVLLAVVCLWVASMPITGNILMAQLELGMVRKDVAKLPNVDAVVVLSGMLTTAHGVGGFETEWLDPDRFFGGLEVYNAKKASKIVFTRGQLPWTQQSVPEGEYLKSVAIEQGVPEVSILLTEIVTNTAEEASATKALFTDKKAPSIILVTSAYHMPRAVQSFEVEGFEVTQYPVDFKTSHNASTFMSYLPNASALSKTSLFFREMLGRSYYQLKNIQM